jgi:hypothetical protein
MCNIVGMDGRAFLLLLLLGLVVLEIRSLDNWS